MVEQRQIQEKFFLFCLRKTLRKRDIFCYFAYAYVGSENMQA